MKSFVGDLHFGFRMLRKSPSFALITIAVLALGIGANAAVFSVVDAVLLRSLPLRDPERVVMGWEKSGAGRFVNRRSLVEIIKDGRQFPETADCDRGG